MQAREQLTNYFKTIIAISCTNATVLKSAYSLLDTFGLQQPGNAIHCIQINNRYW